MKQLYSVVDPQWFHSESDPNPAFHLDVAPDPGNQTNADLDLDPGQTLSSQKVEFLHKKYTLCR